MTYEAPRVTPDQFASRSGHLTREREWITELLFTHALVRLRSGRGVGLSVYNILGWLRVRSPYKLRSRACTGRPQVLSMHEPQAFGFVSPRRPSHVRTWALTSQAASNNLLSRLARKPASLSPGRPYRGPFSVSNDPRESSSESSLLHDPQAARAHWALTS